jgi:phage FluMu protein gp41
LSIVLPLSKLEAEGKADKVEGKVQNAVGGLKDALKSTASTRLRATNQRKTLLASAAMIGVDLFCGSAGVQGYLRVQAPVRKQDLPSRAAREGAATVVMSPRRL